VPRRLVLFVVLALAVAWLGFRATQAFDQDRHAAQAAAVVSATDNVTYDLLPVPAFPSTPDLKPRGRFVYRPGTWLSVVDLQGLEPDAGVKRYRYLVFLRNWAGWTLAGAARPGPDGTAQVRSGAEPRPRTIYEVVVTAAVDDATSVPHGQPVLHWFDGSLGPPRAVPFDFARGT
jgi:hypothetical protein